MQTPLRQLDNPATTIILDEQSLFRGVAIGHGDPEALLDTFERPRVPLAEQLRFGGREE